MIKKHSFSLLIVLLFTATGSFGQKTQPSPSASPTPQIVESGEVVKISTTLIQVDVTVTDKNGKIITDLKPEDFEIFENGEKENITNFSFISTAQQQNNESPARKKGAEGINNIPIPTGQLRPEQVKRTIALVVDDLGLSFESVYSVRLALRKFVDEQMQPNDLVAIIRTSAGNGSLQQFTTDKRQLYAAIERIQWNANGRAGVSSFAPIEPTQTEVLLAQGIPQGGSAAAAEMVKKELQDRVTEERKNTASFNQFREDIFTSGTLGAINYVVKGMGELPGRKSIMLFSDGFSVCSEIHRDRCPIIIDSLRRLTDIVNRASVSIYSFDSRGLAVTAMQADDKTIGTSILADQNFQQSIQQKIGQTLGDRTQELFQKQDGLAYLANETGGRSFFNTNDLNKSLGNALEDQKGYYLIGYQPESETFDPKTLRYNKLQIKVNRNDVNVRYRSGFFGVEDSNIAPSNLTAQQEIYKALTSPFGMKQINVRFNTLFGVEPKTGSYVRTLMHINVKDLKFSDDFNGERKAVVDVLAVTFGEKGVPTDQVNKTVTLTVKSADYEKTLKEGFVYSFIFPVKKPGGYQFGIAIRDSATGKVGSTTQFIEVPKVKKGALRLSGIILENYTMQQWRQSNQTSQPDSSSDKPNPLVDTSLRRFKLNTILEYGVEIYNAKTPKEQKPQLITQLRLFHEGQLVLSGKLLPVESSQQTDSQIINSMGAIKLGAGMALGDYILQIIVIDNLAKEDNKIATEWVQFEIIE